VAALDRALALADRDPVAETIGCDLDLDVARPLQKLFGVNRAVAEGGLCLGRGSLECRGDVAFRVDAAHSLPTPARRGLEQDRITRAPPERGELPCVPRRARHAGHDRNTRPFHQDTARRLRAHGFHGRRRRPDEREPRGRARPRELRALREKSVSRVHERRRGPPRRIEQGGHRQVALGGGRGAQPDRVVRGRDVGRRAVGVGVDRDGLDSEVAAGAKNAKGDFAAVRDEESHGQKPVAGSR
jgi:hypothetical protein